MRHLRKLLNWLLQKSVKAEQTHREKELLKDINQRDKQLQTLLEKMEELKDSRDKRQKEIEHLEHEKDLLKKELDGTAAIIERNLSWITDIREAEETPLTMEMLEQALGRPVGNTPWDT